MSIRFRLKTLDALAVLPANAGGNFVADLRRKTLAKLSGGCGAVRVQPAHSTRTFDLESKT